MEYAGSILVEDASGCQFELYEFRERRLLRIVRRFQLDTREIVEKRADEFIVVRTGETLIRVDRR